MVEKVIVARYNPQHSFHLAAALQSGGLLYKYYTGFFINPERILLFRFLPQIIRQKFIALVFSRIQRYHPELDPDFIISLDTWANILQAVEHRLGVKEPWEKPFFLRRLDRFQQTVARIAVKEAEVLVVYDTDSYRSLQETINSHVVRVLDIATIHWATREALLRQEIEKWPQYSAQVQFPSENREVFQRNIAEPALADYLLVGSHWAKRTLVDNGIDQQRIYVLYYGCDTSLFSPRSRSIRGKTPFRILFMGGNSVAKGYHYVLDTLHLLPDADIELLTCGMLSKNGLQASEPMNRVNIRHQGLLSQEKVAALMGEVDMIFHPSLFDSFSMSCLEGMACGLPVLTTPRSGIAELIRSGENGFVVEHGDVQAMAQVINLLINDPGLRETIGRNARLTAEAHTWLDYDRAALKIFRDIIRRGKPVPTRS